MPRSSLKVAHVGWTGCPADRARVDALEQVIPAGACDVKFGLAYCGGPDRRYGADFLVDERPFDVIVIHRVFVGTPTPEPVGHGFATLLREHDFFAVSPLQSPEAWRRRIVASGARRVIAFGGSTEVAEAYLAPIPGYARADTLTIPDGVVFERGHVSASHDKAGARG